MTTNRPLPLATIGFIASMVVMVGLLLGHPDEPMSTENKVTASAVIVLTVVALIWAYRGHAICKWLRTKRYNRATRHLR